MTRQHWGALVLLAVAAASAFSQIEPQRPSDPDAEPSINEMETASGPPPGPDRAGDQAERAALAAVDDVALSASSAACRKLPVPDGTPLSVASWNLRWFPRGGPDDGAGRGTDVAWMACALARLNAPIIAVQEVLDDGSARDGQRHLMAQLAEATDGRYRIILDPCPAEAQHVGFIFDTKRVELLDQQVLSSLNPTGKACGGQLRPGLAARFRATLGQSEAISVVSLHLDSGPKRRDFENRMDSLRALRRYVEARPERESVLVLGDFNAMGCAECQPLVTSEAERAQLGPLSGMRRLTSATACSHYFRGQPGWLDHALISGPAGDAARLSVHGPCAARACGPLNAPARGFFSAVSDHCPLRVTLGTGQ